MKLRYWHLAAASAVVLFWPFLRCPSCGACVMGWRLNAHTRDHWEQANAELLAATDRLRDATGALEDTTAQFPRRRRWRDTPTPPSA